MDIGEIEKMPSGCSTLIVVVQTADFGHFLDRSEFGLLTCFGVDLLHDNADNKVV